MRMRKELSMSDVQEWGDEEEDGVIYKVTLRRLKVQHAPEERNDSETLALDKEPNSGFIQYKTCKTRTLKAATLEKLVGHLITAYAENDHAYICSFLSTYRAFTRTDIVLDFLFKRNSSHDGRPSENSPCVDSLEKAASEHKSALMFILHLWLEEYTVDFQEDPPHSSLQKLRMLVKQDFPGTPLQQKTEQLLQKLQESSRAEQETNGLPTSGHEILLHSEHKDETQDFREEQDFLTFSSDIVAEQLTLMDAELFMKVQPFYCLGCIWSQRDKKENRDLVATVRATIAQFNTVANCVIASVLMDTQLKPLQRAKVIEKWIEVAQSCRTLNNFSSLRAILSGLQSNAIYRLKKTWAVLCRVHLAVFQQLSEIFADENNYFSRQEIVLQSMTQGTVPYLGTYLTALLMLDIALPDYVQSGLINFEKRRREFEILAQIKQLQASCNRYVLTSSPQIISWFYKQRQLTDELSYSISCEIQPPGDCQPCSPKLGRRLTKRLSRLLWNTESIATKSGPDTVSISSSGSSGGSDMEDGGASAFTSPTVLDDLNLPEKNAIPTTSGFSGDISPGRQRAHKDTNTTIFPVYNQQTADSCIIRVSVENNNGNLYKSILMTSQDKTPTVIQRALEKHNLEYNSPEEFQLIQIHEGKDLIFPDDANVFYAMNTSVNFDFVLRRKQRSHSVPPAV
ncbi:ral guanine nucleotide dissociation stimulator-like 3 [Protopterus annectens]|uniref:ral guanine nucleotide dissociation stimulator-like 3 n=1 Tax=Protopterus annectens TaxID=7888 RepID=UPI001CFA3ACF|nr:ral guanine nucleotide dissociation stimulator-like 3 [Protopterus annectens]